MGKVDSCKKYSRYGSCGTNHNHIRECQMRKKVKKSKEEEALRQKEISEAKTKADIEKLFQARLQEKENEIKTYNEQAKKEKIDTTILNFASKYKAISPNQVVKLIKDEVKLSEDNRIRDLQTRCKYIVPEHIEHNYNNNRLYCIFLFQ